MQHIELNGQVREASGKAALKALRSEGLVPCNLYGCGVENILFTVNEKELKVVTDTPKAYIIDLKLDGKNYPCVLHELQWHPTTDKCIHVDLLAVNEAKPVTISVPLVITGHAIGVQQGGKFYQNARKVTINALPANLPDDVTVDISNLELGKRVKAGEIKVENVTIVTDKDTIICGVKATRNK